MTTKIKCGDCGKETSSYGVVTDLERGELKVCYECCATRDKRALETDTRATLYLVEEADGWKVKNWPGTMVFNARVTKGKHNMGLTRYDAWFRDHKGQEWYGRRIGDNTELVRCRKVKGGSK